MRLAFVLALLLPSFAPAQTKETIEEIEKKLASDRTAKWVFSLQDPMGGFYVAPQDPNIDAVPRPTLRATNAGVKTLKYRGLILLKGEQAKHAAFVLKCYDPRTGGFADAPGGQPDVATTSVGVMAAMELAIPKDKFAKAMDYIKENAKSFEDVRIGAAAVEAWGVKDCPFKLDEWIKIADAERQSWKRPADPKTNSGFPRSLGSFNAFRVRLGYSAGTDAQRDPWLGDTQWSDGGWGREDAKGSDVESTYRVMRALMLLKEKPKDAKKLREFLASHRNDDGGYAVKPGERSNMSGTYFATIITKWLDEMEKK